MMAPSTWAASGIQPIDWLLWGGLAAVLAGLYIGVYVWMRRPKFGEGDTVDEGDAEGHDRSGVEGHAADDGRHKGESRPPEAGDGHDGEGAAGRPGDDGR